MVLSAVPKDVREVGSALGPYPVLLTHPTGQSFISQADGPMLRGFISGPPRCIICRARDGEAEEKGVRRPVSEGDPAIAHCDAYRNCNAPAVTRCPKCHKRACNEHMVLSAVPKDVREVGSALGPYPVLLTHPTGQSFISQADGPMLRGFISGPPRCIICRARDGEAEEKGL